MRRTIANEVKIELEGTHTNGNCKEVYCITDSRTYASVTDAADAAGVTQATMSNHLKRGTKSCNGKQYCFLNQLAEYHDHIATHNRNAIERVSTLEATNKQLMGDLQNSECEANAAHTALNAIKTVSAQVAATEQEVATLEAELERAKSKLAQYRADLAEAIARS